VNAHAPASDDDAGELKADGENEGDHHAAASSEPHKELAGRRCGLPGGAEASLEPLGRRRQRDGRRSRPRACTRRTTSRWWTCHREHNP